VQGLSRRKKAQAWLWKLAKESLAETVTALTDMLTQAIVIVIMLPEAPSLPLLSSLAKSWQALAIFSILLLIRALANHREDMWAYIAGWFNASQQKRRVKLQEGGLLPT